MRSSLRSSVLAREARVSPTAARVALRSSEFRIFFFLRRAGKGKVTVSRNRLRPDGETRIVKHFDGHPSEY